MHSGNTLVQAGSMHGNSNGAARMPTRAEQQHGGNTLAMHGSMHVGSTAATPAQQAWQREQQNAGQQHMSATARTVAGQPAHCMEHMQSIMQGSSLRGSSAIRDCHTQPTLQATPQHHSCAL